MKLISERDYQREAIRTIVAALTDGGTGQLEAACGTGKTRIALRVAEQLVPGDGLVVVLTPTLALVAQILAGWHRDHQVPYDALGVCSDDTVADAPVGIGDVASLADVSTDAAQIATWCHQGGRRVIVGTYASAHRLAEALQLAGRRVDLLVCDEAHHLAGDAQGATRRVLDRSWLPAASVLHMTATRRVGAGGPRDTLSMDDDGPFGPLLYRYPFAQAIEDGWLKDYRVLVVAMTDREGRAMLADAAREYVETSRPGGPGMAAVVAQAALGRAIAERGVRRAISYHYRVEDAAEFARSVATTVARLPAAHRPAHVHGGHVNGQMRQADRELVLRHLVDPPAGGATVIANARCLGEGVDIPAVDAVLFANPKRSAVDIVQAVGRALRPSPNAQVATIIVPVVLPDADDNPGGGDELADLDAGDYTTLWEVVRALRAHDEDLAAELDARRAQMDADVPPQLPSRITMLVSDAVTDRVLASLRLLLLRQTTSVWLEGFGAAQAFHAQHGHLEAPFSYVHGQVQLGRWLMQQRARQRKGMLPADKAAALERLGVVWDTRYRAAGEWVELARQYRAEHGHLNVPQDHVTAEGDRLGVWLSSQRRLRAAGTIPAGRQAQLEELGMLWDASSWAVGYAAATAFAAEHGHLRVPVGHTTLGVDLRGWVQARRQDHRDGRLDPDRARALTDLGMVWAPYEQGWEQGVLAVAAFTAEHGHLRVPTGTTVDGVNLHTWVTNRRADYRTGRLSADRVRDLEAAGMIWDGHQKAWTDGIADLTDFITAHGHARVPKTARGTRTKALGVWVSRQRRLLRDGTLRPERAHQLHELGVHEAARVR